MEKKIQIWDKKSNLKGFKKDIWFNEIPRSKYDTLVLVDNIQIYWLEDIKMQGITGNSDIEIVENYLKKLDDESSIVLDNKDETLKSQEEIIQELKKENETLKNRVDTLSSTVEELVLTTLE